ncbi:MAG: chorismate mutase [Treponema sp.]|jgi:chorismate mutase|nr:chorismate mutase [Treponema sp.]
MKKLFGIRGATQCLNEPADIELHVCALYDELLNKNALRESDIVSIIFSVTADINVRNPASALRAVKGIPDVTLFVVQEAQIIGGLERVIRILLHCYLDETARPVHIYQNGAEILRKDRSLPFNRQ